MRNLQKILALVLALVMSLSLMATAGARDFTDGDQIDETFAESVDVLTGLEVFQGYPSGDFQPKGDITRAEVAAIIYRIATGDVTDSQVGIYADYNKFSDVPSDNWAAGYINYCANAEYIKGRGDGKFYPQDKVTGYEALAMILRVVGYDKNGEFTGADWQVQTAATANQRKVTKNVNAGTLGNPASRETVAELLCQAILIEKVNYTLAFGYQISTDPEDTIAYETFKMEKLEGVVTGNEIADLKESSPLTAGQTRLVIDGREEIVDIPTTLDKIGKSVRAYIRPQGGTTRKQLVTADVYDTELNHVYDSFAPVSSVGNSTGSENGINSIVGAEHFINYDYASRWTASIRITYVMNVRWTEYQALTMRRDNGGKLWYYTDTNKTDIDPDTVKNGDASKWNTQLTTNATYTYTYTNTIALDEMLTSQDYDNLYSIFTNADKTSAGNWIVGEVYVGTTQLEKDISDEIRWTDFVNTYLVNKDNRALVKRNGRGNRLIIIDNDDDGIAEYVLQTIYTIAKVSTDAKYVDNLNTKLYDSSNSDAVNSTSTSDTLVSVSGKELAKSEETLNSGDVVIYALIDGNIRAQKAEIKTEKVNTVNRAGKTITVVGEDAATYNESAVHTHSNGLKSYVSGMVGNTTYTMYFDLDGNLAAYTEGANGGLVLITNGWYRSTIGGAEYAVQAYLDGALQTVNVANNGNLFINPSSANNNWNALKRSFGENGNINNQNLNGKDNKVHTIVANLDGEILTPVDKAYLYSQQLRMLDMKDNVIPGRDNNSNNNPISWGIPYETNYSTGTAYTANGSYTNGVKDQNTTYAPDADHYEVRALSNTVYYTVSRGIGYDNVTNADQDYGLNNVVVRSYTGYNNVPSIDKQYIEDVYVVGAKAHAIESGNSPVYYTAQVVVIELSEGYNRNSEQVFIPDFSEVTNSVGIENVTMIRGNGVKETVQVDMTKSHIDSSYYYDPANGSIHGNRIPGLYFMDPSDSDPNVYVIQRMTPADVRDNDYLVGYVRESYNTLSNNYAQINTRVRPVNTYMDSTDSASNTNQYWRWNTSWFGGNDNIIAAKDTTPVPPAQSAEWQSKAFNTETSKAYTYGGSTASLNEVPATEALAQYRQDNAGTTISGLNERWNQSILDANHPDAFNQNNLNEVLVRYSGGTVVYAISFNETDNKAAQKVWWNYLPLDKAGPDAPTGIQAPALAFYGVNDKGQNDLNPADNEITVANSVAKKHAGNMIDLSVAKGLTIVSVMIENQTVGTIAADGQTATVAAPATPNTTAAKTLTVVVSNGAEVHAYNYELKVKTVGTDATLKSDPSGHGTCGLVVPTLTETVNAYFDKHTPADNYATAIAEILDNNGASYTAEFADGKWDLSALTGAQITTTDPIYEVTITVTAEDGTTIVRHNAERDLDGPSAAPTNYRKQFAAITEKMTWQIPVVGDGADWNTLDNGHANGPKLIELPGVGDVVAAFYNDIDAAANENESQTVYSAAVANLTTAVKTALGTYVQDEMLGGKAPNWTVGDPVCNNWCSTISSRYTAARAAISNVVATDGYGSVQESLWSIVRHLNYVYGQAPNHDQFVAHGD